MSRPYSEPVTYELPIDALDQATASFALGLVESPTAHVRWTMPRDEWERHGRPAVVSVTVSGQS